MREPSESDELPHPQCHAATQLADGRLSIVVDPVASANLASERWARRMAARAIQAGLSPSQTRMRKPLTLQGVGFGIHTANWEVTLLVAARS